MKAYVDVVVPDVVVVVNDILNFNCCDDDHMNFDLCCSLSVRALSPYISDRELS